MSYDRKEHDCIGYIDSGTLGEGDGGGGRNFRTSSWLGTFNTSSGSVECCPQGWGRVHVAQSVGHGVCLVSACVSVKVGVD